MKKYLIGFALLTLIILPLGSVAGEKVVEDGVILISGYELQVDPDRDNIPTMKSYEVNYEDDGRVNVDSEGVVDLCSNIPNVSLTDDHCSVDLNLDGYFDLADIVLGSIPYDHPAAPNSYWGEACQYRYDIDVFNNRLALAGLSPLQVLASEPFIVHMPVHCSKAHHRFIPVR